MWQLKEIPELILTQATHCKLSRINNHTIQHFTCNRIKLSGVVEDHIMIPSDRCFPLVNYSLMDKAVQASSLALHRLWPRHIKIHKCKMQKRHLWSKSKICATQLSSNLQRLVVYSKCPLSSNWSNQWITFKISLKICIPWWSRMYRPPPKQTLKEKIMSRFLGPQPLPAVLLCRMTLTPNSRWRVILMASNKTRRIQALNPGLLY
jgi:hypothetical protein